MDRLMNLQDEEVKNIRVKLILDMTGSMQSRRAETVSGINEYVGTLKERVTDNEKYLFTLAKFNGDIGVEYIVKDVPIQDVKPLTQADYKPDGMTNLYDAVGQVIDDTNEDLKRFAFDVPVLFVIMTDGEENHSKKYTRESLFALIEKQKSDKKSTLVFLGANQDAWAAGGAIGMAANAMNYSVNNLKGTYRAMANQTQMYARSISCSYNATKSVETSSDFWQGVNADDLTKEDGHE
jgi:uncharacterized protein YegL